VKAKYFQNVFGLGALFSVIPKPFSVIQLTLNCIKLWVTRHIIHHLLIKLLGN